MLHHRQLEPGATLRRAAGLMLVLLLALAIPATGWAKGPVEATFRADTGAMELGIVWSAVPAPGQDLPPEAWAMQEPVYGPITELFLPGTYDVTGDAGDTVFFSRVVIKRKGPNDFVIPISASPAGEDNESLEEGHACPGGRACQIDDPSGLSFVLPAGWTSDAPFLAETAGGVVADAPTVTFMGPGGHQVLVLNPIRWIESNGSCTDSPIGPLCIFGPPDGESLKALTVILPTLAYRPL